MVIRSGAVLLGVVLSAFGADVYAATGESSGLEEIVVTAQRREESLQNVGIAISVLSGESLAEKSVFTVNDLQNAVPSLQVEPAFGSGQPQFRLRGIGFIDYTSNNTSPVGVSLDGVPFALPIQTQGQLFDIDRVEVLRGPQGTLYGRNTSGGVINFISNRPTQDLHAGVNLEYGSHNALKADAYLSGGIAPTLAGRLSVSTEQGGAWQRDRNSGLALGSQDKVAVRGQLAWDPLQGVDVRLGVHFAQDKSDEQGLHLIKDYERRDANGVLLTSIPADTSRYTTAWNLNPAFAAVTGLAQTAKPGLDNTNAGTDLTATIDLGFGTLTSISAYNRLSRREYSDWDVTQFYDSDEYLNSDFDVFSQEVRLASAGAGPFGWLAGAFYSNEYLTEDFDSDFTQRLGGIAATRYEQKASSLGVFGQVSYQFTEQFKATLGVREDHENREIIDLNTAFVGFFPSLTGGPLSSATRSNLPSGKFELDYKPTEQLLTYASVSRGVKSGGFTAHNTINKRGADPFNPERLTAYEVGVKADIAQTVRIDASVFYYRYRDQQILGKVFDDVSQSYVGRFTNVNSSLHGGELEVQWRPLAGLSVSQYLGFVEGHYTSTLLNSDTPAVDYNGQPESYPKWTYGGDLSYSLEVGRYKVTAESNYSFHDRYSQFYLLGSSNDFTIARYWLANANLSLAPASGGPWTFTLWGRNIFDRNYDLTRNFFLPSAEVGLAGEPATFGLRVSYKY